MASLGYRLLHLTVVLGFLSVSAKARPGLHFRPYNTLLLSYSVSSSRGFDNQNPNSYSSQSLTLFTRFMPSNPQPFSILLDRPNFLYVHDESEVQRPGSLVSSLRNRTKDILSVALAMIFGIGCGFLTAATMYMAWSLFSNRVNADDSYRKDYEDPLINSGSPKMIGYVEVPAFDPVAAPASA